MNKKNVKVSIVVPVYNTEQYLQRCFNSICGQTLKEIEIILVDDGSDDGSGKICDAYAAKDTRIHVIHQANGGLVSARQAGLGVAIGEYIGFVDSDDWVEPDMYQALYELAVSNKADVVVEGIVDEIGDECWRRLNTLPHGKYETVKEKETLCGSMISCKNFFCLGIQPYLCNKLVRRDLAFLHINKVPRSIQVGEDAAAMYPMFAQAGVIVVSDTAHYHYCHRDMSMMQDNRQEEREYENAVLLQSFLEKRFQELGVYERMREQLRRYAVNNLLTRTYGKCVEMNRGGVLFPFVDIFPEDTIVLYGAGAFGQAVYQYVASYEKWKMKAWIDQRALAYQRLKLEVRTLEEVEIEESDKIVVAVLSETAYWQIRETLMRKGVELQQIKWIDREKLLELLVKLR